MPEFADAPEVDALIARLYDAFDEPNDLIDAPRFSPDREEFVREVLRYTRDTLPDSLVDLLAWRLVTTVGTAQTLRHYLPRIFRDALESGGLDTTPWEVFADHVSAADFSGWSIERRRLTLQAFKFWIAADLRIEQDLSARDHPDLAAAALATTTTMHRLAGLVERRAGMDSAIAFLLAAAEDLDDH